MLLTGVLIIVAALALAACQPSVPAVATPSATPNVQEPTSTDEPTSTPQPEPVTVSVNLGAAPQSLDPVHAAPLDSSANDLAANLFAGLARLDGDTGRVSPLLAESWEQIDEQTWYVYLRADMPWAQVDATSSDVVAQRPVTAADIVTAAQRACHPQTGTPLGSYPALFLIEGCEDISSRDAATLTPEYIAQVLGVRALNDTAVEFRLTEDSALFPTLLASPQLIPVPADVVEAQGEAWGSPANIWTNGPFALQPTANEDGGYTLLANPQWPLERGNVDVVRVSFGVDAAALDAWQAGDLDLTVIPGEAVSGIDFEDDPAYRQLVLPAAELILATYDLAPIKDANVRQGLSLALDRQAIIDNVLEPAGQTAIPATGIVPPGVALSPAYSDVEGTGYDPAAARDAFAEAGYRDCDFMPVFTLMTSEGSSTLSGDLAAAYRRQWNDVLGCTERISIQRDSLLNVMSMLEPLPEGYRLDRPGLLAFGWQGDTPDAHHWLADIFGCRELFPESFLNQGRECVLDEEDLLGARQLHDDDQRAAVYAQLSEDYFAPGGEMPVIPVFFYTRPLAINAWLTVEPQTAGPLRFDQWAVDTAGQP